ncbi:hypothetical protein, partial [Rheinheimera sp.]|uniref:hypothetical protein n=1 Tax=Rheinheimera sp. TaxID=1869214 RepID=UPI0027B9FC64
MFIFDNQNIAIHSGLSVTGKKRTLIDANLPPLKAAGIELVDVIHQKVWDTFWFQHSESEQQ